MGTVLEFPHERALIEGVRQDIAGSFEELVKRFRPMLVSITRLYFAPGITWEDLYQEALIGLYKAALDFNGKASFQNFAKLCVERNVLTAVTAANRKKHSPLNNRFSLEWTVPAISDSGGHSTLQEVLEDRNNVLPDQVIIRREELAALMTTVQTRLSALEHRVFVDWVSGYSYLEIEKNLGVSAKAVDNALQRVRHKLAEALNGTAAPRQVRTVPAAG